MRGICARRFSGPSSDAIGRRSLLRMSAWVADPAWHRFRRVGSGVADRPSGRACRSGRPVGRRDRVARSTAGTMQSRQPGQPRRRLRCQPCGPAAFRRSHAIRRVAQQRRTTCPPPDRRTRPHRQGQPAPEHPLAGGIRRRGGRGSTRTQVVGTRSRLVRRPAGQSRPMSQAPTIPTSMTPTTGRRSGDRRSCCYPV